MKNRKDLCNELEKRIDAIQKINLDNELQEKVEKLYSLIEKCFSIGNKIILCGNGGSAADCEHVAAEFVVKLSKLRKSLPAISLTSNCSIMTAIANDIDYDNVFVRQIESIANENDVLIGISTSGNSTNVIKCIEYANDHNIVSVSITGESGGLIKEMSKHNISLPSGNTQIIQELYMMMFHIICANIEHLY